MPVSQLGSGCLDDALLQRALARRGHIPDLSQDLIACPPEDSARIRRSSGTQGLSTQTEEATDNPLLSRQPAEQLEPVPQVLNGPPWVTLAESKLSPICQP